MPMIRIEFDNKKIKNSQVQILSEAVQKIVSEVTNIEDVFVYANSSQIKVKIAPIEILIQITASKINNPDQLIGAVKSKLFKWKEKENFDYPINLTLIPMEWRVEIGI